MNTDDTEFRRLERHLISIESKLTWLIGLLGAMAVTSSGAINFPISTSSMQSRSEVKADVSHSLPNTARTPEVE